MKTYCVLFVLSTVSYQCYGGLLDGILSGAHQTHNKVHDVANTFLGGLTQGLNVNFQGHFGVNNQQRPPQQHNGGGQSGKPGETVVIVVEEGSNYNQPRPGYNNRPQHHQPGYGGNNRPGYGNKPQYNNPGYGNPYQKPSYNNHGYGNGNWNGNYQPNNGNPNQNNYGQPNRPSYGNQGGQNNQYTTEFVTKEPEINTPHYGSINTPPNENNEQPEIPAVIEKTTKKPAEDKPLFVPLNPNEYNYGGDKIDVTAPKRETNDNTPKPAEPSDDDDFPIDIRLVPPPRQYPVRPSTHDCDQPEPAGTDLDRTHATLKENQPKRRLFISHLIPTKMSQPSERTNINTTAKKSSDVYENIIFVQENTDKPKPLATVGPPAVGVSTGNEITTIKPEKNNVTKPVNTTEITVDERSSFDGDQCPTGYVRLNGKCVPTD